MAVRTFFVLTLVLAVLTASVLAIIAWWNRRQPGIYWFAIHAAWVAIGSVAALNSLVADTDSATILFGLIQASIGFPITVSWFFFIVTYLGYGERLSKRIGHLSIFGVGGLFVLSFIPPQTREFVAGPVLATEWFGFLVYDSDITLVSALVLAVSVCLFLTGIALILQTTLTGDNIARRQAFILGIAAIVPVIAALVGGFSPAIPNGAPVTAVAFVVSVICYGYALQRYDFFTLTPATERIGVLRAFESLGAGVLVTGQDDTVLEVNETACRVLHAETASLHGSPLNDVLGKFDTSVSELPTQVQRDGNHYWLSASPIVDDRGATIGRSVLLLDITDERLREQRLDVLDRILRHNLRNKVNVISTNISVAAERTDDEEVSTNLETARLAATELLACSEKARAFEGAINQESATTTIDLPTLLEEIRNEFTSGNESGQIELELPEISIETNDALLSLILTNLIENAILHTDTSDPEVRVTAHKTATGIEIEISDSGPGIPEHELEAIRTGTETALNHGSGLGLWLVTWAVGQLGGSVTFEQLDPGTRVQVRIPDRSIQSRPERSVRSSG